VTGALTTIDVQDFAGDEVGVVQIHNRLSDVVDFAHVADRVQIAQRFMGFFAVHRGLDDARGNRVHPNPALGVLNRQGFGRCVQTTFGQRGQYRRHAVNCVVCQAGGDVDDVAFALFFHLVDRELGDVEEAVQVHRQHVGVVFGGVRGERFGDEDTGVVDQGVDAAKTCDGFTDDLLCDFRVADVARHGEDVRVGGRFDRTRRGDDFVIQVTEGFDHAGAEALGCASDNDDFFRIAHDEPLLINNGLNK
jgi:hypothetical protein